jgi:hypothetical protein
MLKDPMYFKFPDDNSFHIASLSVEKAILIQYSPVFESMLNGSFVESHQNFLIIQEATVSEWTSVLIWMLENKEWMATCFSFTDKNAIGDCAAVIKLFHIASKYLIQELQTACCTWFQEMLQFCRNSSNYLVSAMIFNWLRGTAADILGPIQTHHLTELCIQSCISTLSKFIDHPSI